MNKSYVESHFSTYKAIKIETKMRQVNSQNITQIKSSKFKKNESGENPK